MVVLETYEGILVLIGIFMSPIILILILCWFDSWYYDRYYKWRYGKTYYQFMGEIMVNRKIAEKEYINKLVDERIANSKEGKSNE